MPSSIRHGQIRARARRLTVKLRGRTEAPALGAEGAQFLSARGANQEARHGPLQRLLDGVCVLLGYKRRRLSSLTQYSPSAPNKSSEPPTKMGGADLPAT